jgi:hypothetical protein
MNKQVHKSLIKNNRMSILLKRDQKLFYIKQDENLKKNRNSQVMKSRVELIYLNR